VAHFTRDGVNKKETSVYGIVITHTELSKATTSISLL